MGMGGVGLGGVVAAVVGGAMMGMGMMGVVLLCEDDCQKGTGLINLKQRRLIFRGFIGMGGLNGFYELRSSNHQRRLF